MPAGRRGRAGGGAAALACGLRQKLKQNDAVRRSTPGVPSRDSLSVSRWMGRWVGGFVADEQKAQRHSESKQAKEGSRGQGERKTC